MGCGRVIVRGGERGRETIVCGRTSLIFGRRKIDFLKFDEKIKITARHPFAVVGGSYETETVITVVVSKIIFTAIM